MYVAMKKPHFTETISSDYLLYIHGLALVHEEIKLWLTGDPYLS